MQIIVYFFTLFSNNLLYETSVSWANYPSFNEAINHSRSFCQLFSSLRNLKDLFYFHKPMK